MPYVPNIPLNSKIQWQEKISPINIFGIKKFAIDFLKLILSFCLIFNLSFTANPALSTGRIAMVVMLAIYGKATFTLVVKFAKNFKLSISFFILPLPLALVWYAVNGAIDAVMISRVVWFLIYSIIGSFLYMKMYRMNLSNAMFSYMIAIFIQAAFVYISVLSPDFRVWVDAALQNGGNIDFSEGIRFSGLTNGGGANLSVQLSLGVAAAFILFSQSSNLLKKCTLILTALLIAFSTIFVGRTGMYLSFLTLFCFVFLLKRSLLLIVLAFALIWLSSSYISSMNFNDLEPNNSEARLDKTFDWAFDFLLSGESSSASSLTSELANLRPLQTLDLLIGSGRVSNPDGSNYCGHDSGYIHTLYAIGLPLTIFFYSALLWIYLQLLSPVSGMQKVIGLMLVGLVFIVEIKEPFVFKYTLPFFVLTYVYLARWMTVTPTVARNFLSNSTHKRRYLFLPSELN